MSSPTIAPAAPTAPVSVPPDISKQARKWIGPLALGFGVLLIPTPSGLTATAWHYFALFAAVIAALVTEPLPGPAVGFIGVTIAATLSLVGKTPAEATKWALSGFSNDAVWLIFAANMFALGYEMTGLGRRIVLVLVKRLGQRTLGLAYAIALD
ncbi:MAG: anion permease [Candidatus Korobacteraceae bacterium]